MKVDIKKAGFQPPDLEPQKFTECKWTIGEDIKKIIKLPKPF